MGTGIYGGISPVLKKLLYLLNWELRRTLRADFQWVYISASLFNLFKIGLTLKLFSRILWGTERQEYLRRSSYKARNVGHWVRAFLRYSTSALTILSNGWYDPKIQYQAYYNFTVEPGNTYDYSPFNDSVKAQFYNNLYGPGNCVDQINDCAARGYDSVCEAAVSIQHCNLLGVWVN